MTFVQGSREGKDVEDRDGDFCGQETEEYYPRESANDGCDIHAELPDCVLNSRAIVARAEWSGKEKGHRLDRCPLDFAERSNYFASRGLLA